MTQLQQVEFQLLEIFVQICTRHKLTYYLVCGTALGAEKYSGFIPWDDDIDVGLPRDEYERFLEIASKELPEWCFLQNYRTDPNFPFLFSKLRNSNTTYIEKNVAHIDMNHGVYIDIFPLDGYPQNVQEQRELARRKKLLSWMQFCALKGDTKMKVRIRNLAFRMLGFHHRTARTIEKMEMLISRYPAKSSEVWCNHGNWQGELEYAPRWQYGAGTWRCFEGIQVRVPEKTDAYLTQKYGDWRADLPEEKKVGHHFYAICDLQTPYTCYTKDK